MLLSRISFFHQCRIAWVYPWASDGAPCRRLWRSPILHYLECNLKLHESHDLVQCKTLLVTYQAKMNALPSGLQNMFTECNHSYNTRSSMKGNFYIKHCSSKRDLLILVILVWYCGIISLKISVLQEVWTYLRKKFKICSLLPILINALCIYWLICIIYPKGERPTSLNYNILIIVNCNICLNMSLSLVV